MKLTTCWKHENLFLDAWEKVQFTMPRPWNSRAPYIDLTKSIYTIRLHPIPSHFLRKILCLEGFLKVWWTQMPQFGWRCTPCGAAEKFWCGLRMEKVSQQRCVLHPAIAARALFSCEAVDQNVCFVTSFAGPKELVGAIYSCNIICSFMGWSCIIHMAMDQYLYIPFLVGWTSMNPSYFDVHQGHTAICFPGEVLLCIHPPRWPAVSQMSWPPDLWNLWTLEGFTRPHPENSSWSSASGIAVMVSTCIYNTIIYHKSWKDLPFLIRPYFEDLLVSPRRWAKRMSAMAGAFGCETETLGRQGHHT